MLMTSPFREQDRPHVLGEFQEKRQWCNSLGDTLNLKVTR